MKVSKRNTNLTDDGYIPFNLDENNKTKILYSILILNDGSVLFGR